ncbi:kinase-like domain-containing protein [Diplogelasinospora grovesii]|uniref:non-specific serine/threonine protein kinase n=1 Tax=Diplogelasinospora grovesii TaxID=303347 RepID=A0AAN6S7H0_9PEZI|nr:kinase-like domain-containing protein [Diplogelasinospora grovesii]
MAGSPGVSSDEGEIVEAPPLPRLEQNGDVDRSDRHRGTRFSRTPEHDLASSRNNSGSGGGGDGSRRRSGSPRGLKRSRGDRDGRDNRDRDRDRDRRDTRHFRVHYEDSPRDDPSRYSSGGRDRDLDRPSSRGSYHDERSNHRFGSGRDALPSRSSGHNPNSRQRGGNSSRDLDRSHEGYPDKRPRKRSLSPRGRRDRERRGDRVHFRPEMYGEESKYSAQDERRSQDDARSKRTPNGRASGRAKRDAKTDQGVPDERGIERLAISQNGNSSQQPAPDPEPDLDFDPASKLDEEAAVEAEIQRRRKAREAALKRGIGATTPTIQALQTADRPASTPTSTRLNTPGPRGTEGNTPRSNAPTPPPLSPAPVHDSSVSPAAFNFADDQALINTHGVPKAQDEDGPAAADYDPTADMREDERRDEMRYGNVGLHGEARRPSHAPHDTAPIQKVEEETKKDADEDEDFDMFAEDFADKFAAPAPSKAAPANGSHPAQPGGGGGGILEGDDKDGYYKIRPGELLDGRYQISTTLGRGMFSGVARALDVVANEHVAIKIMRNNDALRKGGYTEIAILQKLNAADPDNKKHVVKFERSFEYKGHLCMAFENLSMNLREVLKKFGNNVGINLSATRAYAYQIFLALGHMRKCSIIHADLKPDNILVSENRNVLKICDLGTAIDRSDAATASTEITPYLVSRFYRAPEIILGMPYDYAIDMWSIGCTLYELYTGKILFTGDSNNQMLKNIQEIRGKLSAKLYRRGQLSSMHFDEMGNFLSVERDKVLQKTTVRTLPMVKPTRDLRTRLLAASSGMNDTETRELNYFIDLLERCLTLNPEKRLTPSEALRHPFFLHRAHPPYAK